MGKKKRKRKKEFVHISPKRESVEKIRKIYSLRVKMGILIFIAGILISFIPAFVPQLNSFATVGVMLGMPIVVLGIVAYSMYRLMLRKLELSS